MAETLTTLKARRSCRKYKPELIEQEKLDAIIEAGTYAATGMGKQSPIIIAVTDKEMRDLCEGDGRRYPAPFHPRPSGAAAG